MVHLEDKHVGNTQAAATAQAAAAAGTDVSQYVFSCCFFFYHPQWLVPFSIVGCGGACSCCAAGAVPSLPSLSLALFSLVMSHSFARTHAQKPLTDTYLFFPFFSLFFPCPTLIKPPTAQQPRGKEAALPLGRVLA